MYYIYDIYYIYNFIYKYIIIEYEIYKIYYIYITLLNQHKICQGQNFNKTKRVLP